MLVAVHGESQHSVRGPPSLHAHSLHRSIHRRSLKATRGFMHASRDCAFSLCRLYECEVPWTRAEGHCIKGMPATQISALDDGASSSMSWQSTNFTRIIGCLTDATPAVAAHPLLKAPRQVVANNQLHWTSSEALTVIVAAQITSLFELWYSFSPACRLPRPLCTTCQRFKSSFKK